MTPQDDGKSTADLSEKLLQVECYNLCLKTKMIIILIIFADNNDDDNKNIDYTNNLKNY